MEKYVYSFQKKITEDLNSTPGQSLLPAKKKQVLTKGYEDDDMETSRDGEFGKRK